MNAKANTNANTGDIKPGDMVKIISTDDSAAQAGTLGLVVEVDSTTDDGLATVELPDGRKVQYLPRRLRHVQPEPELVALIMVGDSLDFASASELDAESDAPDTGEQPTSELLPTGTQVVITTTDTPNKGLDCPAGLFAMIIKHGPLYGKNDADTIYDYLIHATNGSNYYVQKGDIAPIHSAAQADPNHPLSLMEKLSSLRSQEKQMMRNLSEIRHEQHEAQIREQSLRACGDKLREDRKLVVRQCEELEFSLTRAISAAA